MKVALKLPNEKYFRSDMLSWKTDIEKALAQLDPITMVQPTPWTPILRGTTVAGAPTYSRQVGEWMQIGQRLFFNCYVLISAIGGMTGNVQIAGLPKPSRLVANMYQVYPMRWNNVGLGANGTAWVAQQSPGASYLDFIELKTTGTASVGAVSQITATTDFIVSGSYVVTD